MARPLRIQLPGAAHDVVARGDQGRAIFADDADCQRLSGDWLSRETVAGESHAVQAGAGQAAPLLM